jgi:DNA-binding IclR family transcriptional regulator
LTRATRFYIVTRYLEHDFMMRNSLPYQIGSLARALSIVNAIAEAEEITLTALSQRLDIPKGTMVRHLRVLEAAGYVSSEPRTKTYSLGRALIHLGFMARQRLRVTDVAEPAISWLRDMFEESVHLGILAGADVIHVSVAASLQPINMAVPVGARANVHTSALGKALIAWSDPAEIDELVALRGLASGAGRGA